MSREPGRGRRPPQVLEVNPQASKSSRMEVATEVAAPERGGDHPSRDSCELSQIA